MYEYRPRPGAQMALNAVSRCAHSPACLEAAELHLRDGDWQTAQRVLHYSAGARPPQSAARWMNAVGLSCVLAGDMPSALAWLEKSLALPFGATHLAAAKTLYWVAHLQPEATHALANVNGSVAGAASLAFGAFQQTRAHVDTISDDSLAQWQLNAGPSIFDLAVQRQICEHPTYDRHTRGRQRHKAEGRLDEATRWRRRYIDLLQRSLTRYLSRDLTEDVRELRGEEASAVREQCDSSGQGCESPWHIGQGANSPFGPWAQKYLSGLVHLNYLVDDVLEAGTAGDFLEAGCYTAGTAVLLRALLEPQSLMLETRPPTHSSGQPRRLLLADSFEGIPQPRTERGKQLDTSAAWPSEFRYSASEREARSTLRRYGFEPEADERIEFLPGYFNESLPMAPTPHGLALVHIDADAYDSVLDALRGTWGRVSPGGYVVIDDFHLPGVRAAVLDFRREAGIAEPLLPVPSDHVTTCAPAWDVPDVLTVHPLTVAYWARARSRPGEELADR